MWETIIIHMTNIYLKMMCESNIYQLNYAFPLIFKKILDV